MCLCLCSSLHFVCPSKYVCLCMYLCVCLFAMFFVCICIYQHMSCLCVYCCMFLFVSMYVCVFLCVRGMCVCLHTLLSLSLCVCVCVCVLLMEGLQTGWKLLFLTVRKSRSPVSSCPFGHFPHESLMEGSQASLAGMITFMKIPEFTKPSVPVGG